MGFAELDSEGLQLLIHAHIITYGNAATPEVTEQMRDEVETMWNEPSASVSIHRLLYRVVFRITAAFQPDLTPVEIYQNLNPANNYFRIEEFAVGNISFVDGLGCNSGYFKMENLYKGSTTAAHEFGHTLGLDHPKNLDIRGKGIPGIMYPRGTLVDPAYQYDPSKPAGVTGGTLYPIYRKVRQEDIELLELHKSNFQHRGVTIGEFTNIFHVDQGESRAEGFL